MNEQFKKIFEQVSQFSRSLSLRAKVTIIGSIAVVFAALSFFTMVDHENYATLFSGLSMEDAARITEELQKRHVKYRLDGGGTMISVPQEAVHEVRISLAGQGLPKASGVGFEIFDEQKFGVSDFAQQINYRRALQGELERTIQQIEAVQAARVHIALPNREIFARQTNPPSASVTVRLHPGRTLTQGNVKAIVHLVSSSVSGLNPNQISVVDTSGSLLSGPKEEGTGLSDEMLSYKSSLEKTLETRVAEILQASVGAGHAVIKVTADVGVTQIEQTDEEYDPDKTVVRSESTSEEQDLSNGKKGAGIPGTKGNLPGGPEPSGGDDGSARKAKQATRNFEINKTVRRTISGPGELKRLSVAVLIDSRILGAAGVKKDAKGAATPAAISTANLVDLEQVVKRAVGFSDKRGDQVTLKSVPFVAETSLEPTRDPLWIRVANAPALKTTLPAVLIGIGILVWLLRLRKGSLGIEVHNKTVKELEGTPSGGAMAPAGGALNLMNMTNVRQLAQEAAEQDAGRTAQVLRAWIARG